MSSGAAIVVSGVVEHGDQRGRVLGFPTANLRDVDGVRLDGVYAGLAQLDPEAGGPVLVAAVSVGHRPTYYRGDGVRLLEAHLLDFAGSLYGRTLRVELHTRLRPQVAFVDTPTLVQQLQVDVEGTRSWARARGLDALLAPDRSARDRGPGRTTRGGRRRVRTAAETLASTARRREARLLRALAQAGPGPVSHEEVAELSGLPLDYLRWRLPTTESLGAVHE